MRFLAYFDTIKFQRNALLDIGVTSNGFGLLFVTGRSLSILPPPTVNELNYYSKDGTTLLLNIPIANTYTGTLYDRPIAF